MINNQSPEIGDKKITASFLIFPKTINGETRWLENAARELEFRSSADICIPDGWVEIRWVD